MDELLKIQLETFNALQGDDDTGVKCDKCKNRGFTFIERNGSIATQPCECAERRNAIKLARKSNCADLLAKCTLDNYETKNEWQSRCLKYAKKFVAEKGGTFFIGGQVGSGKTHICTGIINELLKQGIECRYYVWGDIATALNRAVNDGTENYNLMIDELMSVPCIYIDDFLRNQPTQAEKDKAFKIINARYNAQNLLTVISSEKLLDEIIELDEAVGTRIFEMAHGNIVNIERANSRNWRVEKVKAELARERV